MNCEDAGKKVSHYLKSFYGFALKRTTSLQDAEDLTQEIALRFYRALLADRKIDQIDAFFVPYGRLVSAQLCQGTDGLRKT